jgi:hypothetical protein
MVNVNAHIPFNLYNQTLSNGLDPSSSRSGSASRNGVRTNHHNVDNNSNGNNNTTNGNNNYPTSRLQTHLTPSSTRQHSPSPRSMSRSSRYRYQQVLPHEEEEWRYPILGVRLVRGGVSASEEYVRRGRRVSRSDDSWRSE